MLQRHTVQELHGDEGMLTILTDFVDGANVGVIECRRCSRLPAEAFQSLWIAGQVLGQKFQCNKAAKLGVFGLVNYAHPAAAELSHNAVVGHGTASKKIFILMRLLALLLRDGERCRFYGGTLQKAPGLMLCP